MSELWSLALAVVTGILLGAIFFGGLWWTVRHGISSNRAGLWFMGSMLLRIGIVMTGFYFLLGLPGEGWKMLLAGLLGFIIARRAATRLLPVPLSALSPSGLPIESPAGKPVGEASHAP
ncbi:ATP synthase subunit I [Nitrosospira sp. Nsp13]|jgi:F1F0 ATPase subunit 2|uniref:ATP synthase subunit I n=1 Tax=Nitrosospira sp. Nsp13 TaxID=1855332 RepID=UPI00088AB217|nr:ATP synthase subunit I [Nitrosospira sp. Nsp13]SCX85847.1 F1/F0 ATPase, subunit 2 [Nitrosospira sp. Nsp13]